MSSNERDICKSLNEYQRQVIETLTAEMNRKAQDIKNDMVAKCPVRTGALKASLTTRKGVNGYIIRAGADYGMHYGGYVEPLRPYIRPAFAKNLGDLNNLKIRLGAKGKIK